MMVYEIGDRVVANTGAMVGISKGEEGEVVGRGGRQNIVAVNFGGRGVYVLEEHLSPYRTFVGGQDLPVGERELRITLSDLATEFDTLATIAITHGFASTYRAAASAIREVLK